MGYGYSGSYSAAGDPSGLTSVLVIVLVLVVVAWLMSIPLLIDAAKDKGYFKDGGTGKLWFVGLFATPIVVGLYVAALPDLKLHATLEAVATPAFEADDLPEL